LDTKFPKLQQWLKKHGFLLAAFLIPLFVRSIPEALAWPYPLGLDTLNMVPIIQSGSVFSGGVLSFFHSTNMFYFFSTSLYGFSGNIVFVLDFFGPVLLAILCGMMFIYSRKALQWANWKSLLVSVLVATYFVSLRDSWDLYRQMLGLIFLMAALIALVSFRSPRKYYVAGAFMVLTVLSHELVTVILFFIILVEVARLLIKKSLRESGYLLGSAVLAGSVFLFQRVSLSTTSFGSFGVPGSYVASGASVSLALFMAGLLVYCYVLILPLVLAGLVGFKVSQMHYWALLCIGIILLLMVNPNFPLYFWNRWVYLLVYPLLFFTVHGLDNLWRFWSNHKSMVRRWAPKVFAVAYVIVLLTLSGFYLGAAPEKQVFFFSSANPYLSFIPSSMLQNTLSISDNPKLVNCFKWINSNSSANSVLVVHYALVDLADIYVKGRIVVPVYQGPLMWDYLQNENALVAGMVDASQTALNDGNSSAYTIWWASGQGWYGIPSLPTEFKPVFQSGDMAVYLYNSSV